MADVYGPTLGAEIVRAGVPIDQLTWTNDGRMFGRQNLTSAQNTTLTNVIARHDPTLKAIPYSVTRRQFVNALSNYNPVTGVAPPATPVITQAEALAALNTGAMPTVVNNYINSLPSSQQYDAQIHFAGQADATRGATYMTGWISYMGWTAKQGDDLFRYAATL